MSRLRVCSEPGCPDLTTGSKCEIHRKADRKRSDAKRLTSSQRGYDAAWRKTRAEYLARYPDCEEPGCNQPATDVDHIDGQGPNGPRGHDWSNFRSLCHAHHSKRTARDQPGGFNRR